MQKKNSLLSGPPSRKCTKKFSHKRSVEDLNSLAMFSSQHGWKAFASELPLDRETECDVPCVVVINDNMASYGIHGSVMNPTWAARNYKKEGWTHWMYLPPRPRIWKMAFEFLKSGTPIVVD